LKVGVGVGVGVRVRRSRFLHHEPRAGAARFAYFRTASALIWPDLSRSRDCSYPLHERTLPETQTYAGPAGSRTQVHRCGEHIVSGVLHEQTQCEGLGSARPSCRRHVKQPHRSRRRVQRRRFSRQDGHRPSRSEESRAELAKIRMGRLDNHSIAAERELESEASQLSSIYATIIMNMKRRLERERGKKKPRS
jgi:hypothetical protein